MLSFWVSLLLAALVVFLFLFPWRLFFFVVGLLAVGPQNWVLRMLEERGRTPKVLKRLLHRKKKDVAAVAKKKDGEESAEELPADQPIASAHTSDGVAPLRLSHDEVDSREIHQVSVPYSQLMYQRFYDWPPEAEYAKVKLENPLAEQELAANSQHSRATPSLRSRS
jgi:hypothetical protein